MDMVQGTIGLINYLFNQMEIKLTVIDRIRMWIWASNLREGMSYQEMNVALKGGAK